MAKDASAVIELLNRRRAEDLAARGEAEPEPESKPEPSPSPRVTRRLGDEGRSRVNFNAPNGLIREFKARAAREGTSMTDVLLRFMREYVDE